MRKIRKKEFPNFSHRYKYFMRIIFIVAICLNFCFGFAQTGKLPEGFIYVKERIPDVVLEMRYAEKNNFIGKPIAGYNKPVAILSKPAA